MHKLIVCQTYLRRKKIIPQNPYEAGWLKSRPSSHLLKQTKLVFALNLFSFSCSFEEWRWSSSLAAAPAAGASRAWWKDASVILICLFWWVPEGASEQLCPASQSSDGTHLHSSTSAGRGCYLQDRCLQPLAPFWAPPRCVFKLRYN